MAWYSLYKWFISWRKTPYRNMISWYKKYLFDQWFESLSDADKQKYLEYKEAQKRKRERSIKEFMLATAMITTKCGDKYNIYDSKLWRNLL